MKRIGRFGKLVLGLIVIGLVAAGIGFLQRPGPPPFLLSRRSLALPVSLRDRVTQFIPTSQGWGWAWQIENALLGKRKPVTVSAELLGLTDLPALTSSTALLGAPSFSNTNGIEVWLLPEGRLKAARKAMKETPGTESLFGPRISTADSVQSSMFVGVSHSRAVSKIPVGFHFDCVPMVRASSTDLTARINLSELVTNNAVEVGTSNTSVWIRTNLNASMRIQIPKGSGLFFLDKSSRSANGKIFGLFLDPP